MRKALGSALSGALVVLYAVGAYYTATRAQHSPWAVLVAIGPLTVAALLFVRKALGRIAFAAALIAAPLLLAWAWPLLQQHIGLTYYLQHLGLMLCGALGFGLSLIGPRTPLCTQFAAYVHTEVTAELRDYTRKVTVAWTLFFIVMAVISTLLFFLPLPFALWSAFDTLLTLPLVGLMFAVEYAVRRHVMPDETGQSITSAYRAYQAHRADRSAGTPP